MDHDQEIEKMYHPENFEKEAPFEASTASQPKDAEDSPFDLDIERLFGFDK